MSAISCTQTSIFNVVEVLATVGGLFNPAAFVNPQITAIVGLQNTSATKHAGVLAAIALLNPLSPTYLTDLAKLEALRDALELFGGHNPATFAASGMGQFQAWTDFQSGKVSIFPGSALASITAGIPSAAILGTMTFAGLLGATAGQKAAKDVMCQIDPDHPCASVSSIFGSILGAFNAALATFQAGLDLLVDYLAQAVAYTASLTSWINQIVLQLETEIGNLVAALLETIRFSLAKLLVGLRVDPCLGAIINEIASEALQEALDTVPL